MFRIVVALDFSDCSRAALGAAFSVAERWAPASLLLLTVIPVQPDVSTGLGLVEHSVDDLQRMVRALRGERANPSGVTLEYAAVQGVPADAIVARARESAAHLLIVGTRGRTGLDRLILGSVAEAVVRRAPCSVLTVKPTA
ncbi:MAG: universal stress protein [Polyangiales bacterium]